MIIRGRLLLNPRDIPLPGWIAIDGSRIAEIGHGPTPQRPVVDGEDLLISPGFIDAHTHLPQFNAIGCDGMDLLPWLSGIVYPAEGRWSDASIASDQVRRACHRMFTSGTLGFAGFLSPHAHGAEVMIEAHATLPLRAMVGITLMDREAPEALLDPDPPEAPASRHRLEFSVNPRFAISCTERLLQRAAVMAQREGRHIQTHLAESHSEIQRTRSLFPADRSAPAVLDRLGVLSRRTLLAHGVHLDSEDWRIIARRGSIIVHCPSANTFLQSGLFDLAAARSHGVRVALGSDVAAGADLAMPRVARAMIEVAKIRRMVVDGGAIVPTPEDAWELITSGHADLLGWHDAGRLAIGAAADLLVLRPEVDFDRHLIGRLIYGWRDEWISHIVLAGRLHALTSPRANPD